MLCDAGSNPAWWGLTFMPLRPYGMELDHTTLVRIELVIPLEQPPYITGREGIKNKTRKGNCNIYKIHQINLYGIPNDEY